MISINHQQPFWECPGGKGIGGALWLTDRKKKKMVALSLRAQKKHNAANHFGSMEVDPLSQVELQKRLHL